MSPDRTSNSFSGITESFELHANIVAATPVVAPFATCDRDDVIDAGETGRIVVAVANRGAKPLVGAAVTLVSTTPGVRIMSPTTTLDLGPYESTTLAIDIALDDTATGPLEGTFELAIVGADTCEATTLAVSARFDVDDVPLRSATDGFDTSSSIWRSTFFAIWTHERETALDGYWHGVGLPQISTAAFESPPLKAGAGPVTITFEHRYQFESDGTTHFDGGVIEFSVDDGETWIDMLSLVPTIGYGETPIESSTNPIAGQRAFVRTSAGHPAMETVTLDLGTQLANLDFRIRFRIATDNTGASTGWDVDNVAFTGIVGDAVPGAGRRWERLRCCARRRRSGDAGRRWVLWGEHVARR